MLFNRSLEEGVFPDLMKLAKIIPLHKGGEKNECDNYRPTSLLPVISKVLEKLVYRKLLVIWIGMVLFMLNNLDSVKSIPQWML